MDATYESVFDRQQALEVRACGAARIAVSDLNYTLAG